LGYCFRNQDRFYAYETRGYEEELAIAIESGYTDAEEKIRAEMEERRREIYGEK